MSTHTQTRTRSTCSHTNKRAHTSQVINSDGTQLISNSTGFCFSAMDLKKKWGAPPGELTHENQYLVWWHCLLEVRDKGLKHPGLNSLRGRTTPNGCRVKCGEQESLSSKYPQRFLLGRERGLVCRRPQVLGDTEDSNLKLPVCLSMTHTNV